MNRSRTLYIVAALIFLIIALPQLKTRPDVPAISKNKAASMARRAIMSEKTILGKIAFLTNTGDVVIRSNSESTSTIYKIKTAEYVQLLSFSPDGKKLLLDIVGASKTAVQDRILIYDIGRKKFRVLKAFDIMDWIGNDQLYVYSRRYFDLKTNHYIKIAPDLHGIEGFSELRDGERIVVSNFNGRRVFVGKTGDWRELTKFSTPGYYVLADWIGGSLIGVISDKTSAPLLIFDKKTGKLSQRFAAPRYPGVNPDTMSSFISSSDGNKILFTMDINGDGEKTVVWLIDMKKSKRRKLLDGSFRVVDWLPDGRHFLVATDKELWVADSDKNQILTEKILTGFEDVTWTQY